MPAGALPWPSGRSVICASTWPRHFMSPLLLFLRNSTDCVLRCSVFASGWYLPQNYLIRQSSLRCRRSKPKSPDPGCERHSSRRRSAHSCSSCSGRGLFFRLCPRLANNLVQSLCSPFRRHIPFAGSSCFSSLDCAHHTAFS